MPLLNHSLPTLRKLRNKEKNASANRFSPLVQEDALPKGNGYPKRDCRPTQKAAEMEEQKKKSLQPEYPTVHSSPIVHK